MKIRFEIKILADSGIFELSDKSGTIFGVEVGPKRSAEYFANLFYDGAAEMKDVDVKTSGLYRRNLGEALCHVAIFKDHGLFKCSTPGTSESRNLEIYPKELAEWLAKCLESRPNTSVEYELFDESD